MKLSAWKLGKVTRMRGPSKNQAFDVLRKRQIPVSTVLDVGVQRGTPELMRAYLDVHHILFEPVAEFHDGIRSNYRNLSYTLVDAAVADKTGEATLEVRKTMTATEVSHSSVVAGAASGDNRRTIQSITLDSYLEQNPLPKPYLLKIDVDGNELAILSGATNTLKDCSIVVIETPKSEFTKRIAYLEERGFVLFDLVEPCYYDDSFWQCDAILLKADIQRSHFLQMGATAFEREKYTMFTG